MSAIYLKQGDELAEMVEAPYEAEEVMQTLLADYPGLLAGDQDDQPKRNWLLVRREFGVASEDEGADRWSLDHLFLDQEGVPTLVEVKRSTDTRIRREVVGQMLDYAANGSVLWGLEKIRTSFETEREDPEADLIAFLDENSDPEQFWERVGTNLKAGRLRLVFVADEIPSELRRVVEFLNEQMSRTEVVALEVKQYVERNGTRQTLVPRLIGQTEAARQAKGTARRTRDKWDEDAVKAAITEIQPPEYADRMIALYEALKGAGARRSWGAGAHPSVMMWLGESEDESQANPVSIGIYTAGVAINFDFVREVRSGPEMQRFADLMRQVPGVAAYIEGLEENNWGMHRSMRPEDVLATDEALEIFIRSTKEAAEAPKA